MVVGGAGPGGRLEVGCETCKGGQTILGSMMWNPG